MHWAALQGEVGEDSEGPLGMPAHMAGQGVQKLQSKITAQRESKRFQQLDVDIRSLANDDMMQSCNFAADSPTAIASAATSFRNPGIWSPN